MTVVNHPSPSSAFSQSRAARPLLVLATVLCLALSARAQTITTPYRTSVDGPIDGQLWSFYNDGDTTHGALFADSESGVVGGKLSFFEFATAAASTSGAINAAIIELHDSAVLKLEAGSAMTYSVVDLYDDASLEVAAAGALANNNQVIFYDSSVLKATASAAISEGGLIFLNQSHLDAQATDAITDGTLYFHNSTALNLSASRAFSGGYAEFYGGAVLNANASQALNGGDVVFFNNSILRALTAGSVSGGTQRFYHSSQLTASASQSVSGGTLTFNEQSTLLASATGAIQNSTITFGEQSRYIANADRTLGEGVVLKFLDAGTFEIRGSGETISAFAESSVGGTFFAGNGATPTLTFNTAGTMIFGGRITDGGGTMRVEKTGVGVLQLTGQNTFSGGMLIREGAFVAASNFLGTGAIEIGNRGMLQSSHFRTIPNTVIVRGVISPGDAEHPITSFSTGNQEWYGDGAYLWQVNNAVGYPATNWDIVRVNGTLSIRATPQNPFTIQVASFSDITPGNLEGFDPWGTYSWPIATATGGITGLAGDNYRVDTSRFTTPVPSGAQWTLSNKSGVLSLNYAVIPEPSTWTLAFGGMGVVLAGVWWRRSKRLGFSESPNPEPEALRVLVIDDQRLNRTLAMRMLQSRGIEVEEAERAELGIAMHRLHSYDMIFMDLEMPEVDGFEASRRIRRAEELGKLSGRVPIVAFTASPFHGFHTFLRSAGMDYCVSKPLSADELDKVLANVRQVG